MDEPPVRYWLMGANEWRTRLELAAARDAMDEILPRRTWESLTTVPPLPAYRGRRGLMREPDVFTQMPLTKHDEGRAPALHDRAVAA